jgi:hypothetical protein
MNKANLLITTLALAGFSQIASAITFPSTPGLFLYDVATGDSQFAPTVGSIAAFDGTVGDYSVDVSATGITVAGGSAPIVDLDVAEAAAGPGATVLEVFYSAGAFGPTHGAFYTLETTGPASGGPIVSSAYLGTSVFSQSTDLGGSTDVYPATVNATGTFSCPSYYLTLEDAITGTETSVDSASPSFPTVARRCCYSALLCLAWDFCEKNFLPNQTTKPTQVKGGDFSLPLAFLRGTALSNTAD